MTHKDVNRTKQTPATGEHIRIFSPYIRQKSISRGNQNRSRLHHTKAAKKVTINNRRHYLQSRKK
jgi:hypothetical protein